MSSGETVRMLLDAWPMPLRGDVERGGLAGIENGDSRQVSRG
jgi:hypothetical protein